MVATQFPFPALQRMIGPQSPDWPADVARFFLGLSFTQEDRDRMAMYVLLNDLLALLQSRARASLGAPSSAA
jgi:hypothetical protein